MIAAALCGLGLAAGLGLVWSGVRARPEATAPRWGALRRYLAGERLTPALAGAGVVFVLTRWPVAALAIGLAGWFWPELVGNRNANRDALARTEAIATWTEMLRDTLAAAHGLEGTIRATAPNAPAPIAAEVALLAVRLDRERLPVALAAFAAEVAHRTADVVVAALSRAATSRAADLAAVLGTLAESARDEAAMRLRIETSRARLRTAVRVIAVVTAAMAVGLVVFNPSYVAVYATPRGQLVLAVVAGLWALGLVWLAHMGSYLAPDRFLIGGADAEDGGR